VVGNSGLNSSFLVSGQAWSWTGVLSATIDRSQGLASLASQILPVHLLSNPALERLGV
jgi:hypothetical protein